MQITMNGKYQTRGSIQNPSRPVRILAIDLKSRFPVVGVLTDTTGEERPWLWTADGTWGGIHDRDGDYYECYNLVLVPTKYEGWIVIDKNGFVPRQYVQVEKGLISRGIADTLVPVTWEG